MKNKEILTANRNLIINELTKKFKFESIELKDLMLSFVNYTNDFTLTGDVKQLVRLVDGLHTEYINDNDYIVSNGTNHVAMENQSELNREKNKQANNLYN